MAYCTTDDIGNYLGITIDETSTPSSTVVSGWLQESKEWIDHITKTTYEESTVMDKVIEFTSDNTRTSAGAFDSTGALNQPANPDMILLPDKDIISITKVEFNRAGEFESADWEEVTSGIGGQVQLVGDYIQLIDPNDYPRKGINSIRLTYTKGRSTVPATVKSLCVYQTSIKLMEGAQSNTLTEAGGDIRIGDIALSEPGAYSLSFIKQTKDSLQGQMDLLGTHNTYLI